jgi:hypothetical protein
MVSNTENPCAQHFLVAWFGILWGILYLLGQRFIPFVRKSFVIVHHSEYSAQMSFSSAQTKFLNPGHTNAFLTRANEHYAANLRGVNTHLRAKSCPRNQNSGQGSVLARFCITPSTSGTYDNEVVCERPLLSGFFVIGYGMAMEKTLVEKKTNNNKHARLSDDHLNVPLIIGCTFDSKVIC